jgi:hypothetical protein
MPRKHSSSEFCEFAQIKANLEAFFAKEGFPVRIIYRTCQIKFGNESPHNLVPKKVNPSRISIFLDFQDLIQVQALNQIVAIQERDAKGLPLLLSRFGMEKIDLERLPEKYIFNNIEDLKENYRRIIV